ncbi:hypothetical protein [Rothia aeria]|uniref:hypothetical protein n=1 Tax=Rothia aeria TaxID=172042 RepID=UPI0028E35B1C|nr:hypothetical protein [Rothia aeria]
MPIIERYLDMNILYTIAFWVITVGVCAWFVWDWIQRNVNAPQNKDQFIELYRRMPWDLGDYDYDKCKELLRGYLDKNTYERNIWIDTKYFFEDFESKYVNKVFIGLMDDMLQENKYLCVDFLPSSDINAIPSNEFYRNKSKIRYAKFTDRYYNMAINPVMGVNVKDSPGTSIVQGSKKVSIHNNNLSTDNSSIVVQILEQIEHQAYKVTDKRERRVLEDVAEILNRGQYPSQNEIDELTSDVKKRPAALNILRDIASTFSRETTKVASSEVARWFINWVSNFA